MATLLAPRLWQCFQRRISVGTANGYSTTTVLFGRHHGSSYEKYQKARKSSKKKYIDPAMDRLGKVHSPPGMRIAQKIADSHQFEAALASNRHPAMWNDPYYDSLYEEIVALDPPPEVEGSLADLLSVNPDTLLRDLEARTEVGQLAENVNMSDKSLIEDIKSTEDIIKSIKANLRSSSQPADHNSFAGVIKSLTTFENTPYPPFPNEAPVVQSQVPTVQEWNHLFRVYGAHQRAQEGIDLANRLKHSEHFERNESHYAALITACGDSRLKQSAEAVFDDMRWNGIYPSEVSWSALLHAQMKCGDLQAAYTILDRMHEQGISPNVATYTSLLSGIFQNAPRDDCFNQANEVWFRFNLTGVQPNLLAYTAMIKCCCRSREIERALNILDEMRQNSIRPSVVTYNSILRGLASAPQWHRAMGTMNDEVLDMMQADEIPPSVGTFHALITACASVGDVVNAKVYFDEMPKFGLKPTAEIYNAMLFTLGASQAIGKSDSSRRYLTRPRGWPVTPQVLPATSSPSEKTSRLMWDFMDEEKGKKFKGFHDDIGEDLDLDEDLEAFDGEFDGDLDDFDESDLFDDDDEGDEDDEEKEEKAAKGGLQVSSFSSELRDGNEPFGLTWREEMDRTREEAKAIIEKGEKKRLARSNRSDIELVEGEVEYTGTKKSKSRDKGLSGYKGSKSIEEEWELLVHDVYESIKDDPTIVPDTMAKLKAEVDKYPKNKDLSLFGDELDDLDFDEIDGETDNVTDLQAQLQDIRLRDETLPVLSSQFQAPEDGMPWITTEELLNFDWEEASRNAPLKGPRYIELPRLIDNMAASKEFSSLKTIKERHIANRSMSQQLFSEMQEKGLEISVDTLNGMLSVFTKSMRAGAAVEFFEEEFHSRGISPNPKTYRLLVEMHIRKNNIHKAVQVKEEMVQSMGAGDEEVFGMIVRKLADKNRLQEALSMLDEAQNLNLEIRERNKRELRRLLLKEGMALHSLIGPDPEAWRKEASEARRSLKKRDNKGPYILKNMMVGH